MKNMHILSQMFTEFEFEYNLETPEFSFIALGQSTDIFVIFARSNMTVVVVI